MRNLFSISLACATLSVLAACQRPEQPIAQDGGDEFDWARKTLERNPQLEIVAADNDSEVFTVRNKHSGEVLALKLDEIVGASVSQLKEATPAPTAPTASTSPDASAAPTQPAEPAPNAPATADSDQRASQAMAQQVDPSSSEASDTPNYTIERADGQVRVSGPGVSIVSSGKPSASAETPTSQRAVDPVICEGRRMLQLDSRDIYVEGDAIVARGGCELYITNSRVVGSNVGVVVQDATVHIANSHVEGDTASFAAGDGARLFIRNSTFEGLSRRSETAAVQDQGGNRWR